MTYSLMYKAVGGCATATCYITTSANSYI